MPRVRKPSPGAASPPVINSEPGRPYGAAKELQEIERGMPPDGGVPQAADVQTRPPSPGAALQAAAGHQMPAPSPLSQKSLRPGEPVTSGLSIGAGPGPEVLVNNRARARRTEVLEALAADIGSPRLQKLAERARRSAS